MRILLFDVFLFGTAIVYLLYEKVFTTECTEEQIFSIC